MWKESRLKTQIFRPIKINQERQTSLENIAKCGRPKPEDDKQIFIAELMIRFIHGIRESNIENDE